jgi:hypothetical protein
VTRSEQIKDGKWQIKRGMGSAARDFIQGDLQTVVISLAGRYRSIFSDHRYCGIFCIYASLIYGLDTNQISVFNCLLF